MESSGTQIETWSILERTAVSPDATLATIVERIPPEGRSLQITVQALQTALTWNRRHLLATARAVLEALKSDRLTASLRVELAVQALPWDEIIALLIQLTKSGEMHPGVLATAIQAIQSGGSRRSDTDCLRQLEATLSYSQDEQLRRLVAALVAQSHNGWDDERLKRLQSYRSDSAPLVAAAAQFTLPPIETQYQIRGNKT